MDQIDGVVYINLERLTDRRAHMESLLSTYKIKAQRFPAIEHSHGLYGCGLSHLGVLKLAQQNKIISSSDAVTKLNKEMVKYTEEKNRYTENLLKTYSVLNIVALGLLIYIYKSE